MRHKSLLELLRDSELHRLVQTHLASPDGHNQHFAEIYEQLAKKLEIERFVVPVFGVQGCGKSTLLNALLFKHPVLPVEADETTCVPVEVVWAEKPSGKAQVVFQDDHVETILAEDEHLAAFIDNASNPGNKRGVKRVVLESDSDLLKQGLVLVDLPGIGSLTTANRETTETYLKESVGIIFMLRTNPPITQSDSIAIQLQWPRFPNASFIQNRWNDESTRQASEGKEHNLRVLRDIAVKVRVPLEQDGPTIHMVNAYQAWLSALKDDPVSAKQSGLDSATEALRNGVCEWPVLLRGAIRKSVQINLQETSRGIESQIADLKKTREQLGRDMEETRRQFDSYIGGVGEKIDAEKQKAETFKRSIRSEMGEYRNDIEKKLRNLMRKKMKAGIVDGPRLTTALEEEQKIAFDDVVEVIHEKLTVFVDELKTTFNRFEPWEGSASFRKSSFQSEESFKYENAFDYIGSLIGPAAIGMFLLSNPVGWAVGTGLAVAGVATTIIGSWIGSKAREVVLDQRIAKMEPQICDAIERFVNDVSNQLERSIEECVEVVMSALEEWELQQKSAFIRQKMQQTETFKASDKEKLVHARVLKADLDHTKWLLTQLESL